MNSFLDEENVGTVVDVSNTCRLVKEEWVTPSELNLQPSVVDMLGNLILETAKAMAERSGVQCQT